MTTKPVQQAARIIATGRRSSALAYIIRCEVIKLLRIPAFSIPTLLFPILLFAFFGLPNIGNKIDGVDAGPYILASYGAYSMISVALFSFGVSIAAERGLGCNRLLRTTPMHPLTYFVAKIAMAIITGVLTLVGLFLFGIIAGGVSLGLLIWAKLVGSLVLGMIPFVAFGLFIGYVAGPNSAAAIANLIFLPLSFASGLFVPLAFMPTFIQKVAPYLPAYHTAQLAWTTIGAGDGSPLSVHLLWLGGYTMVFLALGVAAYRHDEGKTYG